jgi:hypothetical protein
MACLERSFVCVIFWPRIELGSPKMLNIRVLIILILGFVAHIGAAVARCPPQCINQQNFPQIPVTPYGPAPGPSYAPGPGYAPGPSYAPGPGYAPGPSYAPGPGYAPGPSYAPGPGYAPGPSYAPGPGYAPAQSYAAPAFTCVVPGVGACQTFNAPGSQCQCLDNSGNPWNGMAQ